MNLPPSSLKFLRLAIDPASSDGEIRTSAYQFVRELRRCGFSLPPEAIGAEVRLSVAHNEGSKLEAVKKALQEQEKRKSDKNKIIPIGDWKGNCIYDVPSSILFYFKENTAGLKPDFIQEIIKELDSRGLI